MPLSPTTTDEELAQRARQGDGDAISLLVERFSPSLLRYLTRMLGRSAPAEDLLQDTWLRVMEKLDSYRPGHRFTPWLFAVARNLAIDELRRLARRGRRADTRPAEQEEWSDPLDRLADSTPSVLEELTERDLCERIDKALAVLPREIRDVLTLRFQEQLKLEDIAGVLGLPPSTVKSRLYRGLEQLRRRVGGLL